MSAGFRKDLSDVVNKHSKDAEIGMADWIIGDYLADAYLNLVWLMQAKEQAEECSE